MSFMKYLDKAREWFNQTDRVHDIMRLGLGFTFVGVFATILPFAFGFFIWAIIVFSQEIIDIIKWIKLKKFKKMWKDGIYDIAWSFSGVFLYAVLYQFSPIYLAGLLSVCIIIYLLYNKEVRYKE